MFPDRHLEFFYIVNITYNEDTFLLISAVNAADSHLIQHSPDHPGSILAMRDYELSASNVSDMGSRRPESTTKPASAEFVQHGREL
jgi:hypothetical protein